VSTVAGLPSFARAVPRAARARDPREQDLLFTVPMARGLAFFALSAWGTLHWMSMLQPSAPGLGWAAVAVGLGTALGLLAAGRAPVRWRGLLAAAVLVPAAALAALAGSVPADLLTPDRWGELSSGIGRGIADLPGIRVPYEGLDAWVRIDIPLGGSALVLLAAALAFWPRRDRLGHPLAALVVLIVLYVVPVVALEFTVEFVRGAVFTVLMVAFLRLEKLRMPDTGAAAWLALGTVVLGLVVAPALNRDQPWFDYEDWALETSASKTDTFSWNHTYGVLDWPRDGRELLRVKAKRPAYWKAENLDTFDGRRWVRGPVYNEVPEVPPQPARVRTWSEQIHVTVRNLRSPSFLTAGYAFKVNLPHVSATPTLDGLFVPSRTLRRGDSYTAEIYSARPTAAQRRIAGVERSLNFDGYRQVGIPVSTLPGVRTLPVIFPPYHSPVRDLRAGPPSQSPKQIQRLLRAGSLARTYRLSRRLALGARTPEDYVQRVLNYLAQPEFTYNEAPPRASRTLDGFLFGSHAGYCQQYSGAMALLLRMAGIPARVATGFSTGATDLKTGEFVVRDFDAHSWVEVYYPDWGWITFDPTPAQSPARSQPYDASNIPNGGLPSSGPVPGDVAALRAHGAAAGLDSAPWWRAPLIVLAALAVAASALGAVRRRRRGALPPLFELERALRRARREPDPGTTLHALELRFAATPAAAGYVRTLIESRYREAPGRPTRAQRRGLRAELGRGAGMLGRLRAWWALPPK
jgi:transglutaminase-like putative cysteine protease